jgi:Zn finger protein HypA/HybF involved in hydrogenase expression
VKPWIAILVAGAVAIVAAFGSSKGGASTTASVVWLLVSGALGYFGLYVFGIIKPADVANRSRLGRAAVSVLDHILGAFGALLKYLAIAFKFLTTASCLLISIALWLSVMAIIGAIVIRLAGFGEGDGPSSSELWLALGVLAITVSAALAAAFWFVKTPSRRRTTGDSRSEKPGWCPQCRVPFRRREDELVCPSCHLTLPVAGAETPQI